jgi:hypoxanthine phosphoribosyltransferase
MENKKYYSFDKVQGLVLSVARELQKDEWKPDYIVGITRGGLIPATLLSHYMNVRLETLNVRLRDYDLGAESNLWMAEDAVGYPTYNQQDRKKILIVDDINDTGATIEWIKKDWQASSPSLDWESIWGENIRTAVLIDNEASNTFVEYAGMTINKAANPEWCVFPWESWWNMQ